MKYLPLNLKSLRKKNKFNQSDIAEKLGITTTAYGAYERGDNEPPLSKMKSLSELYGNISFDDLLYKDLLNDTPGKSANSKDFDLNEFDAMQIKLVSYRVQAGYLTNFENLDFREGLDTLTVPEFGFGRGKNLMAFEVVGDSMLPRIEQGDFVICSQFSLESNLTFYLNKKFVINTGKELLVKRLKSFDEQSKRGVFASDNDNYDDIPLNLTQEIAELWKVERIWGAEV